MTTSTTTMATSISQFKPVFLAAPGIPRIPWQRWIAMFEEHLLKSGVTFDATNAARKKALLFCSLGVEGARVYMELASDVYEPYDDATVKLAAFFNAQPICGDLDDSDGRCAQFSCEAIQQATLRKSRDTKCKLSHGRYRRDQTPAAKRTKSSCVTPARIYHAKIQQDDTDIEETVECIKAEVMHDVARLERVSTQEVKLHVVKLTEPSISALYAAQARSITEMQLQVVSESAQHLPTPQQARATVTALYRLVRVISHGLALCTL